MPWFHLLFSKKVYRVQLSGYRKITLIVNYQKKKKSCTFIFFYDISSRRLGEWVQKRPVAILKTQPY